MVKKKVPLESEFQKRVIAYLKSIGAYVIKIHVSSYQLEGEPDIVCCYKGKFYAFELKQGSKLSELQKIKLELIRESGGVAMVVRSLEQLEELFNNDNI
jgi:Holliday junction resolvase